MYVNWDHLEITSDDLCISEYGSEQFMPNQTKSLQTGASYAIHYVVKGTGLYTIDGTQFQLNQYDGFVIRKGQNISYIADKNNPWHYFWIGLDGKTADYAFTHTSILDCPIFNFDGQSPSFKRILDIYNYCQNKSDYSLSDHFYLRSLAFDFLSFFIKEQPRMIENTNPKINYARQAQLYILNNYHRNISVEEIAFHLKISRDYLYKVFQESFHISPKKYMNNIKVTVAKHNLQFTNLSIKEIAASVGFEDQLYFSKWFKKEFGFSPSKLRKKNK